MRPVSKCCVGTSASSRHRLAAGHLPVAPIRSHPATAPENPNRAAETHWVSKVSTPGYRQRTLEAQKKDVPQNPLQQIWAATSARAKGNGGEKKRNQKKPKEASKSSFWSSQWAWNNAVAVCKVPLLFVTERSQTLSTDRHHSVNARDQKTCPSELKECSFWSSR